MTVTPETGAGGRVVALCGGVGGAKLALGLSRVVPGARLSVVVNTGDDFRHFGLLVCPDLDTVLYTLAGVVNRETGWGRAGESWRFMATLKELGGEAWFNLGDTDLAAHAVRTARLEAGERLTSIIADMALRLGVEARILPVSDDPVRTIVHTDEGSLPFQRYFVGRRCEPAVRRIEFDGAGSARLAEEVVAALEAPDLRAIVICPSNPYLSIDPMLAVPGLRERLSQSKAPVVAVSPIVGGQAIKGPLAKIMAELGLDVGPQTVADHYGDMIDVLVADVTDRHLSIRGPRIHFAQTVMRDLGDRTRVAREVLEVAGSFEGPRR
jgi:LPPG:FO 2-phospho-L-lactate transferase